MTSSEELRILSLNCWGLKYVTKHRTTRINAITRFISTSSYDFVCLQELFVTQDFETIRVALLELLPYAKVFHGGAVGHGLVIFSRFPIVSASSQQYSLNGSPFDLAGADWSAGKAATSVLVKHPVLGQLHIFNTHFFSEGGDDGPEHLRAHRLANAWEFAKLVKQSAELGRHVIAAGDFNSCPHTLPMTVVLRHGGLIDAWGALHATSNQSLLEGRNIFSATSELSNQGATYASPLNSYSTPAQKGSNEPGQRLDYILFRNPAPSAPLSTSKGHELILTEANVVLKDLIPGQDFSYSDHFGVEATFRIDCVKPRDLLSTESSLDKKNELSSSVSAPVYPDKSRLSRDQLAKVIDALKTHLKIHQLRARREIRISALCGAALFALLIGTGWSPKGFLTPLFVFIGAVITWFGTTVFYVGLFYGRWETSLLKNLIEEMQLYIEHMELD